MAEGLGFANVHYFAAGATLFGDEVQGAYQFDGKEYVGRNAHVAPATANCTECHSAHELEVKTEECTTCHAGIEDVADIRMDSTDYDGDGDTSEGIAGEIADMTEALYAAMQAYAASTEGVSGIEYDAHAYPYFFDDAGERLCHLDAGSAAGGLQLPVRPEGPRRLCPQPQVRHPGPVRQHGAPGL